MLPGRGLRQPRGRRVAVAAALSCALTALTAPLSPPASAADASRADGPHAETWWYDAMKLDQVHKRATGKGVTVAVLDDGMQPGIPSLEGADITMMKSPCLQGPAGPRRAVRAPGDRQLHGGEMAALVAGNGNGPRGPGSGIKGVAPDARILVYDLDDERKKQVVPGAFTCTEQDMGKTILAALDAGADVISMSWATNLELFELGPAIEKAVAANKAVLVAANNDTAPAHRERRKRLVMPSGVPGVVSVNALDREAKPWKESLTLWDRDPGETQDWYAPVVSAPGVRLEVPGTAEADDTGVWSTGTSDATALVAGALAVVKEKYPRATANQLIQNLVHHTTRDDHSSNAPDLQWVRDVGFGIASPLNMLEHDPTRWPDENPLPGDPTKLAARYPSSLEGAPAKTDGSASPAAEGSTSAGPEASGSRSSSDTGAEAEDATGDSSSVPWLVAAGVVLLLVLGLLAALVVRRRKTPTAPSGNDSDITHDLHDTGGR